MSKPTLVSKHKDDVQINCQYLDKAEPEQPGEQQCAEVENEVRNLIKSGYLALA